MEFLSVCFPKDTEFKYFKEVEFVMETVRSCYDPDWVISSGWGWRMNLEVRTTNCKKLKFVIFYCFVLYCQVFVKVYFCTIRDMWCVLVKRQSLAIMWESCLRNWLIEFGHFGR